MKSPTTTTSVMSYEMSRAFASDGTSFDPNEDRWSFRTLRCGGCCTLVRARQRSILGATSSADRSVAHFEAARNCARNP